MAYFPKIMALWVMCSQETDSQVSPILFLHLLLLYSTANLPSFSHFYHDVKNLILLAAVMSFFRGRRKMGTWFFLFLFFWMCLLEVVKQRNQTWEQRDQSGQMQGFILSLWNISPECEKQQGMMRRGKGKRSAMHLWGWLDSQSLGTLESPEQSETEPPVINLAKSFLVHLQPNFQNKANNNRRQIWRWCSKVKVCWELKKRMGPVTWKQELPGRTINLGGRLCTEESLTPLYRVEIADL